MHIFKQTSFERMRFTITIVHELVLCAAFLVRMRSKMGAVPVCLQLWLCLLVKLLFSMVYIMNAFVCDPLSVWARARLEFVLAGT